MELKACWNVFCDGGDDIFPNPLPFAFDFDAFANALCDFACAWWLLESEEVG